MGEEADRYLARLSRYLPGNLLTHGRFILWEARLRASGRVGKVPVAPSGTGAWRAVNASDDRHWRTWEQAVRDLRVHDREGGLALILSGSGLVGVDLDDCVQKVGGQRTIVPEVRQVLHALGWPRAGYLELSPSGTGLHLIGQGRLGAGLRKRPGVELLDGGILTLTGQALRGEGEPAFPDGVLAALQGSWAIRADQLSPTFSRDRAVSQLSDRTDAQLINKARNSRNGPKFRRLHDFGDSASDYASRSEGVAGLLSLLLYWCDGDVTRAERLYRQSSLYRTDLDDRPAGPGGRTRLQLTIERVVAWRRRS